MVNIELSLDFKLSYFSLKLEGHAAYAKKDDIVCSGVSTLTESLLAVLEEEGIIEYIEEPGNVSVAGPLNEKILDYLHFVETGYKGISMTYPDNVCFKALQNVDNSNKKGRDLPQKG